MIETRKARLLATAVVGLAVLQLGLATPALASGWGMGCNPNRPSDFITHHFSGWTRTGVPGLQDVTSTLREYSPYVHPDTGDPGSWWVSAWSMVTDQTGGGYAQVGWMEKAYGVRNVFREFGTTGYAFDRKFFPPVTITDPNTYTGFGVHTSADGTSFYYTQDSSFLGASTKFFSPNMGDIASESVTRASQLPGGSAYPMDFGSSYVNVNGGVQTFNGDLNYDSFLSIAVKYSPTEIQAKDWNCPN